MVAVQLKRDFEDFRPQELKGIPLSLLINHCPLCKEQGGDGEKGEQFCPLSSASSFLKMMWLPQYRC